MEDRSHVLVLPASVLVHTYKIRFTFFSFLASAFLGHFPCSNSMVPPHTLHTHTAMAGRVAAVTLANANSSKKYPLNRWRWFKVSSLLVDSPRLSRRRRRRFVYMLVSFSLHLARWLLAKAGTFFRQTCSSVLEEE